MSTRKVSNLPVEPGNLEPLPKGSSVPSVDLSNIPPHMPIGRALLLFAGVAEGLPADMAENHDHYLHSSIRS